MPRHVSTHFAELNFALSKVNNSYTALCLVCGRYLKNTAAKRILAHRNICRETGDTDANNSKTEISEAITNSDDLSSSPVDNQSILRPSKVMRNRGDVWKFFDFNAETKRVTCKYCDKQYKRNATRMQEHLNACTAFQTAEEKMSFEIKYRSKEPDVRVLEDIETEDSPYEDINFESDLIQVEHQYNTAIPDVRSHIPLKRRYSEKSSANYNGDRRDEFDIYGEHVGNELRKLKQNALLLANTKHELNEILHKAVIESLKPENFVSVVDVIQSS